MTAFNDAMFVLQKLEYAGHQARLAGGCVRDRLLGHEPNDYDVATTALPEQVLEVFYDQNVIPTGLQHGTVTVVCESSQVEITTLRIDKDCDGRHAEVEFTNDWKEDAARRDFTFNAMFEDRDGKIYDFFGGERDLSFGRVVFVGNAKDRIEEDYLRIMRFFRFSAKYGLLDLDHLQGDSGFQAILKLAPGLRQISQERTTAELIKTLQYDKKGKAIQAMHSSRVLRIILPEYDENNIKYLTRIGTIEGSPIRKIAFLLYKNGPEKAEEIAKRLKLSSREVKQIKFLCTPLELGCEPADTLDLYDEIDKYFSSQLEAIRFWSCSWGSQPDNSSLLTQMDKHIVSHGALRTARIPVEAKDLMKLGIKGKMLGETLKVLKRAFRNKEWTTSLEALSLAEIVTKSEEELAVYLTDKDKTKRDLATIGMK